MRHRSLHPSALLGLLALTGAVAGCLVKDSDVPASKTDGATSDAARTDGSDDGVSAGAIGTGMGGSGGSAGSGPVDAPPPEPDGAGTCAKDKDCAPGSYCGVSGKCGPCTPEICMNIPATRFCGPAGQCVRCNASTDCDSDPTKPLCLNNECVGCGAQTGAGTATDAGTAADAAPSPDAGSAANVCSTHPGKTFCERNSGQCVQCLVHKDCAESAPICTANACGKCTSDDDCKTRDGSKPACDTQAGTCVECLNSAHCTGDPKKPICHTDERKCYPCTADGECAAKPGFEAPGICMFHQDGRCATEAESIYVQNTPSCTGGGQGTSASPFCFSQDAIGKVSSNRRVIVMKGNNSNFTAQLSDGEVTVIGKEGAAINPGVFIGINLTKGALYVRGVTVENGTKLGVFAGPGTTLRVDRCLIHNNFGGLVIDGAGYQIVNTIVAGNQAGIYTPVGAIGGVYLRSAAKGLTEFRYNTIVNNKNIGLQCEGPYSTSGLILTGNELSPPVTMCTTANSVIAGDCMLDPTNFHLTASSTNCIDQGGGDAPRDDFDGDTRPQGGKSDIGADEYR